MRYSLVSLSLLATAIAIPGTTITTTLAPKSTPPPGCYANYIGRFQIVTSNVSTTKRSLDTRAELGITLEGGVMTDSTGRTAYIASNSAFQFDDPTPDDALYTSGFTVCQNDTLALGGNAIWYSCLSGSYYSLYYTNQGSECTQTFLVAHAIGGSGGPVSLGGTSSTPTSTSATTSAAKTSAAKNVPVGGLSTAAKTGVGVGVGVGALVLLGVGSFLFVRRRRAMRPSSKGVEPAPKELGSKEPDANELSGEPTQYELMEGRAQTSELPVKETAQELPAER